MRCSGEEFGIRSGPYSAVVTEVGATLRHLRHGGRDLVVGFEATELRPVYRGAVLAPWPNRIVDGRYEFGAAVHQLPLTEPDRGNALYGFVCWESWRMVDHTADRVVLSHRLHPREGYPFRLDLEASYILGPDGLTWRVSARNTGDVEAPYGCPPDGFNSGVDLVVLPPGAHHAASWLLSAAWP